MAQTPNAPISPGVLSWAMDEGGYSVRSLAERVRQPEERVRAWLKGEDQPSVAQLRQVAEVLRRPTALFYLAEPPQRGALPTKLRGSPGPSGRTLSPEEIREVRWARRVQEGVAWLLSETEPDRVVALPAVESDAGPGAAAAKVRDWLNVDVGEQMAWEDAGAAYKAWRAVLSDAGLLMFQLELGRGGIRGFSARNDRAPLIAVNSAFLPQARSFSVFHELGHLVRGQEAACLSFVDPGTTGGDPVDERWCESFAAAFLLPRDEFLRQASNARLAQTAEDTDAYEGVRRLARQFKVSVRAAAIRAEELGVRTGLYALVEALAPIRDDFPADSKGGGGAPASERRLRYFGLKVPDLFVEGVDRGLLTERDAGDYLHLSPVQYSELELLIRTGATGVDQ